MVKTRTYEKHNQIIESYIYEGSMLVMHLIFYAGRNYGYPRYHFENFALQLPDLDYEIARFMKFVHKCLSNPSMSVDDISDFLNGNLFTLDL